MKYRIIILTLLLAAFWGCETFSGKSVTETVNIENTYSELYVSDASDIEGEINVEKLIIHLANASDAQLTGHVGELTLNFKNASSIKKNIIGQRYGLSCDNCDVALEDASNAYIHCDGTIRVIELSGASDLHYTGNAEIILTGGTPPSSSDIKHDIL